MNSSIDKDTIKLILKTLGKNGFQAFIVGGAVRDTMLNKNPEDYDILTNAPIKKIESLFSDQKIKTVGKSFPICLVNGVEVSSGRSKFDKANFPESDLAKRDFTINSMAYDPVAKKIIDPFNGRKDLEDGIIRFTKDPEKRIQEDPVRMIRACRFAALIDGDFSLSTLDFILGSQSLISTGIAKQRISHEIIRAMALEKPSGFFKALKKTDLLSKIVPSLDRCYDLDGGPHHGETVFEHCLLVGDALPRNKPLLRLAGFLHDAGKFDAATIKDGKLTFAGHEHYLDAVKDDLLKLRFPVNDITYILSLAKTHMRPLTHETTPRAARRLLSMLEKYGLDYRDFVRMRIADKKGNLSKSPYTLSEIKVRLKKIFNEINSKATFSINNLAITGNDIMELTNLSPGPDVGKIKQLLFERVLDDPELNNLSALKKLCLSVKIEK